MGRFQVPSSTASSDSSKDPSTGFSPRRSVGIFKVPSASSSDSDWSPTPERSGRIFRVPSTSPSNSDSDRSPTPEGQISAASIGENSTSGGAGSKKRKSILLLIERPRKRQRQFPGSPESSSYDHDAVAVFLHQPSRDDRDLRPVLIGREITNASVTQEFINIRGADRCRHDIIGLWDGAQSDSDDGGEKDTMEFSNIEDLNDYIHQAKVPEDIPTKSNAKGLAESLIWHTLISLLSVVHYLQTGNPTGRCLRRASWKSLVHNLINPFNIFYRQPFNGSDDSYSDMRNVDDGGLRHTKYGACMLGGFSRAFSLPRGDNGAENDDDQINERLQAFADVAKFGEETGFEAPELFSNGKDIPGPASDLWSIGAVIVAMMTGHTVWDLIIEREFILHARRNRDRSFVFERWQDRPYAARNFLLRTMARRGEIAIALPHCYSEDLRILVEGLLVPDPLDRGEAIHVLKEAEDLFRARLADVGEDALEAPGYTLKDEDDFSEAAQVLDRSRKTLDRAERLLDG